jgi:cyclopropane fatty-acyl-phospholipid synthase-like methyltransferase
VSDSASKWLHGVVATLPNRRVRLGRATSAAYMSDPAMLAFILARYKFVAKMLSGKERVLEVGCGDAFGAPLVAQRVGVLIATDIDRETLADNAKRLAMPNLSFHDHDFALGALSCEPFNGAYAIDVLEHIYASELPEWMANIVAALTPDSVLLLGTPNATSQQYASRHSKEGHVNVHSAEELTALGQKYFRNSFLFSQHDEVVTTAFAPMAQYLWLMGVGPLR